MTNTTNVARIIMLFALLVNLVSCQGDDKKSAQKVESVKPATAQTAKNSKGSKGKFYGAKPTQYPSWFKESFLDFRADIADAQADGKRVMVIFHQNGCPYCNLLITRNFSQTDIVEKVKKHFEVITINMWGDLEVVNADGKKYTEKTFAETLKVQFTPTILFYNEAAKIILRLNGYQRPRRFKVALDYVSEKKEKESDYRSYVQAKLPAGEKGDLNKEDFFATPPYDLSKKQDGKPQLTAVFFEQKDCPNCSALHKDVLLDEPTREIIMQFNNIQLDMWSKTPVITYTGKQTTARQWAEDLDVKYAPSILIFDENGNEIIRSEAFFKVFHTQGIFAYALEGAYKKQPSFQRYLSDRADHMREKGENVDIWRLAGEKPAERQ